MRYPVIVESISENEYVAEPLGRPELKVIAPSEAEALAGVGRALEQWLRSAKVVQVDVRTQDSANPWLDSFGRSADDPDYDEYLDEVERARF